MPKIQLDLTDEESEQLQLYIIRHRLAQDKRLAIKHLIGTLKLKAKK